MSTLAVCGLDDHFQLIVAPDAASEDGYSIVKVPKRIKIPQQVVAIAAGEYHTVFVMSDGTCYGIGSDRKFRIGTPNKVEYESATKLDINGELVRYACCGEDYTAYLTHSGRIVMCSGSERDRSQLVLELRTPAVHIAGNNTSICAIDSEGGFYLFQSDLEVPPKRYKLREPVFDIARGNTMTIVVTVSGVAYGNGRLNNHNRKFVPIPSLAGVTVRRCFTKHNHVGVITADGRVMMWGDGLYGQLGNGTKENNLDFDELRIEPGSKVISMGMGISHTVFVTSTGNVYSCGWNKHGELGLGHCTKKITTPTKWVVGKRATHVWCGIYNTFVMIDGPPIPHPGADFFHVKL